MTYDYSSYYLIHSGIHGQKWGVRRYENEDGTLTLAGKERYRKSRNNQNDNHDRPLTKKEKKHALKTLGIAALATTAITITGAAITNRVLNNNGYRSLNSMALNFYASGKEMCEKAFKYITRS